MGKGPEYIGGKLVLSAEEEAIRERPEEVVARVVGTYHELAHGQGLGDGGTQHFTYTGINEHLGEGRHMNERLNSATL